MPVLRFKDFAQNSLSYYSVQPNLWSEDRPSHHNMSFRPSSRLIYLIAFSYEITVLDCFSQIPAFFSCLTLYKAREEAFCGFLSHPRCSLNFSPVSSMLLLLRDPLVFYSFPFLNCACVNSLRFPIDASDRITNLVDRRFRFTT